jgi:hypothetical protein
MKVRIIAPLLSLFVLLLTACPPPLTLHLHNNTGEDLTVLVDARRVEWQSGTTLRIANGAEIEWKDLQWEEDSQREANVPVLVVESREGISRYRLAIPGLPDAYVESRTGRKERFLQLEGDGRLHVVKAGSTFPVEPPPQQPPGMPIEPVAGS